MQLPQKAVIGYQVQNGNPNGDFGGGPRLFHDGTSWITDVCVKKHLREAMNPARSGAWDMILDDLGIEDKDRYHTHGTTLMGFEGAKSHQDACNVVREMTLAELEERYWDVRLFGVMALEEAKKEKKGKKRIDHNKKGCVVLEPMFTIAEVEQLGPSTIVRRDSYNTKESGEQKANDIANGAYHRVRHGLYWTNVTLNALDSEGVSDQDLELLKLLLQIGFPCGCGQQRPGVMTTALVWLKSPERYTDGELDLAARELRPKVKDGVEKPRWFDDYDWPSLAEVQNNFPNLEVEPIVWEGRKV